MLIRRSELRLALTAGLVNGFSSLAAVPFGIYAPMAVLAVCTGTYGGSIGLGRQRLLGSVLGVFVLLVSYGSLGHLPIPLGLSAALIGMRLLGGALQLEVGYKVGSNIIVMGWLVHNTDLHLWAPVRLFWTVTGILLALLSLRLFWPDLAVDGQRRRLRELLAEMESALGDLAERIETEPAAVPPGSRGSLRRGDTLRVQRLRGQLVTLRGALPAVADELGNGPSSHPTYRLFRHLHGGASQLISVIDGLSQLEVPGVDRGSLEGIHRAEADLLRMVAGRLGQWRDCLDRPHQHRQAPPATTLVPPPNWQSLAIRLHDPDLENLDLQRLHRNATRLMLCGQALRGIEQTEQRWRELLAQRPT
jgi:uncharacterized membrane protein YccC